MPKFGPITFGIVIAYFLPGIIVAYAMQYISPRIGMLFQSVAQGDKVAGPAILVAIITLFSGLAASAFRSLTLDTCFERWVAQTPDIDYAAIGSGRSLTVFQDAIDNIYRYYQFYGNTCISLLFLIACRYGVARQAFTPDRSSVSKATVLVASLVTMFFQAKGHHCKTVKFITRLNQAKGDKRDASENRRADEKGRREGDGEEGDEGTEEESAEEEGDDEGDAEEYSGEQEDQQG